MPKTRQHKATTDQWGIDSGYVDSAGKWHATTEKTRRALLAAMGVRDRSKLLTEDEDEDEDGMQVIEVGTRIRMRGATHVQLETGETLTVKGIIPATVPLGYHSVYSRDREKAVRLIVCPPECHLPGNLNVWGWSAQLYATRSKRSWGMGDLEDLHSLARWSANEMGAGMLMVNPLLAPNPIKPLQPSPYFPSTRRFRDPLYLRIEKIPALRAKTREIETLAKAGRELNASRQIDRNAVFELKLRALERLWRTFKGDPRFDRYCDEQGKALEQFAIFCVLAERFRCGWREWPARFRHPLSPDVSRLAVSAVPRIRFHCWVQWLLDEQLKHASGELPLIFDLPIGFDSNGADAWVWQDLLAKGVTVGAPPDSFNTRGQDWGLPPFVPHQLKAAGYDPFIQTIRASLRHAGGLRIDHVMGLFRLYWIPPGAAPSAGAYVRYPHRDLLGILALESARARAVVVGEDLGTVEPETRRELKRRRILSYRVLWFEDKSPARYSKQSLAAVTTHDLPTIAGLWTGSDLKEQQALGLSPNKSGMEQQRRDLGLRVGLRSGARIEDVVVRTHALLAQAPSHMIAATLDDALGVVERPNMPGTTFERPNWACALPVTIEEMEAHPLVRAVAGMLSRPKQKQPARKRKR